jgi:hypothetical protein
MRSRPSSRAGSRKRVSTLMVIVMALTTANRTFIGLRGC